MRKRKSHILKPNTGTELPQQLLFFDTETTEQMLSESETAHRLKLGWCCYLRRRKDLESSSEEYFYFEIPKAFWEFVFSKTRPKTRMYLIAHNAIFDLTVTQGFHYLIKNNWKLLACYCQYQTTILKFRKDSKTLIVLDNMNFFRSTLKALGREVGIEKGEVDFNSVDKLTLSRYCKQDVKILVETWKSYLEYLEKNDLGCFGLTVPQQAFKTYLHKFYNTDISIHSDKRTCRLERSSYYGGRCEAFFIGKVREPVIYILDVNSMYPAQMVKHPFPYRLEERRLYPSIDELKQYLKQYYVVAEGLIEVDEPAFPVRMKHKLFFPVGKFNTCLCTPELQHCLELYKIHKVDRLSVYSAELLFKEYAYHFYQEKVAAKEEGNKAKALYAKLMLNSLYGKFGQLSGSWKRIGTCDPSIVRVEEVYYRKKKRWGLWYYFGGNVYEVKKQGEAYHSFPAVAAHVTSYARLYLWKLIKQAGQENVFYCDTDSLFTNKEGLDRLKNFIDDTELGMLSVRQVARNVIIRGCKDYTIDGKRKQKGRRENAVDLGNNTVLQEQWSSLKGLLRRGDLNTFVVSKVTKQFRGRYDKGTVLEDGRVIPFYLQEG